MDAAKHMNQQERILAKPTIPHLLFQAHQTVDLWRPIIMSNDDKRTSVLSHEARNKAYYEKFWAEKIALYESHPTGRHRRRFILKALAEENPNKVKFVFDFGCGSGAVLREAKRLLNLTNDQLGGCDISEKSTDLARGNFPGGSFYLGSFPELEKKINIAICSEVLEHTTEYSRILKWIYNNLADGGVLVLTVPGGSLDPPDASYGHVQHFTLNQLRQILTELGFTVTLGRYWGFPLFSLQKWVTRLFFGLVQRKVLDTGMNPWKAAIFDLAFFLYHIHDIIPYGPQIFIKAKKET